MSQANTVTATFNTVPVQSYALTVTKDGTGSGTVTSDPAGINCGSDCTNTYNSGTNVTLTATPATGSTFAGWSGGGCSGTGTCTVTMDQAKTVTATFTPSTFILSISKSGTGSGTVTSSPGGINCGSDCLQAYDYGTSVTLTATPATGSTFAGWSGGGCSGTGACTVTMSQANTVTATFNTVPAQSYALTVTKDGTGSGTVTSDPAGINCGSDCTNTYNSGTNVTLTATPATGSTFAGWSGGFCPGTGTCTVPMSQAITVAATFNEGCSSPPSAPLSLDASDSTYSNNVFLNWYSVLGATSYNVYRAESLEGIKSQIGNPLGSYFLDLTALEGTTYYYWVKAVNDCGESDFSPYDTGSLSSCPIPSAPQGVMATDGTYMDKVKISWKSVSGSTHYKLYRAETAEGVKSYLGVSTSTSFDDTTVIAGNTYYYWVTSNVCKESDFSSYNSGYASTCHVLSPPSGLTVKDVSNVYGKPTILLDWDPVEGATGYVVYWDRCNDGTLLSIQTTTYPGLLNYNILDEVHYYRVTTLNDCGESELSSYIVGSICSKAPGVRAVSTPSATDGIYADKVRINWYCNSNSNNATSYNVYRAISPEGVKSKIGTTTDVFFDDTHATPGIILYYWVEAVNDCGETFYNFYDSGYVATCSPTPTVAPSPNATSGTYTERVRISWYPIPDATTYRVFRADDYFGVRSEIGNTAATFFDDTTATPGTTYYYWVKAVSDCGETNFGNFTWGFAAICTSSPSAPTDVTATEGTYSTKVRLTWKSDTLAPRYKVYRATSPSGDKSVIGNPTSTSFDDTTAIPGTTYYYWVTAVNNCGESSFSFYEDGFAQICSITVSPSNGSFGANGGSGSIDVSAISDCSWTTTKTATWISIASGVSGSGSGSVLIIIAPNPGVQPRSGSVTIAGKTYTVNQDGAPCTYAISPAGQSFNANARTGSISVTAQDRCGWTAVSNVDWITISSGASGDGNGSVGFSVAANPTAITRSGTITAAGKEFNLTQAGVPCTYAINPSSKEFTPTGGTCSIDVTSPTGCTWTATEGVVWLTITSGSSGNGNGAVNYSVANNTDRDRIASITVKDQSHTVTQKGTLSRDSSQPGDKGNP